MGRDVLVGFAGAVLIACPAAWAQRVAQSNPPLKQFTYSEKANPRKRVA